MAIPRITAEIYDALDHDAEYVTLACKNLRKDDAALGLELVAVKGRFQLKDGEGNILYHGGKGFRGIRAYVWGYGAGLKAAK